MAKGKIKYIWNGGDSKYVPERAAVTEIRRKHDRIQEPGSLLGYDSNGNNRGTREWQDAEWKNYLAR